MDAYDVSKDKAKAIKVNKLEAVICFGIMALISTAILTASYHFVP